MTEPLSAPMSDDAALERGLLIVNRKGLHARATAKFVQCCEKFDAVVTVTKDGATADGSSILDILMLGAGIGATITVSAEGPDAEAALAALAELVANRFGEEE